MAATRDLREGLAARAVSAGARRASRRSAAADGAVGRASFMARLRGQVAVLGIGRSLDLDRGHARRARTLAGRRAAMASREAVVSATRTRERRDAHRAAVAARSRSPLMARGDPMLDDTPARPADTGPPNTALAASRAACGSWASRMWVRMRAAAPPRRAAAGGLLARSGGWPRDAGSGSTRRPRRAACHLRG